MKWADSLADDTASLGAVRVICRKVETTPRLILRGPGSSREHHGYPLAGLDLPTPK